jgi:MFS family permease
MMQVGTAVGRPFFGVLSDHYGRMTVAGLLTVSNTIFAYAIWIPAQSYGVLIFFALVVGATSGVYWGVSNARISPTSTLRAN